MTATDGPMSPEKKGMLTEFSLSLGMGVCSGYAVRRVSQEVAYTAGCFIVALQLLKSAGYITINWGRIEGDITKKIDQDGDGKVTAADLNVGLKRLVATLKDGMVSGAGFAAGFYMGLRGKFM